MLKRRALIATGAASGAATLAAPAVHAQDRASTVLVVAEAVPNTLDTHVLGANRAAYEATWNCCDRLIAYNLRRDEFGNPMYDDENIRGELAEEFTRSSMSYTFRLRRDATFHDGTPVTTEDVKWTYDRALAVGGFPRFVFNAISILKPEQFVAVDPYTFRVDLDRADNGAFPYLASPSSFILNSKLVRAHLTEKDPYGLDWTRVNDAGSGAYRVQSFKPGQEMACVRDPNWNRGPKPTVERVVLRMVPDGGTRRALLERGDIDLSYDMSAKDAAELASAPGVSVMSTPMDNVTQFLGMNVHVAPFDNPKVREAIAYAIPYDEIVKLVLFGRGRSLGNGPARVTTGTWPQPGPWRTDPAKAKAMLAAAGYPNGFDTTLAYDLSSAATNEPLCILLQNSLAAIGIRVSLVKVPASTWRAQLQARTNPFVVHTFGGWLRSPYFYFGFTYYDADALHNAAAYSSAKMREIIDAMHYSPDPAKVRQAEIDCIQLAFDDLPMLPLYQPTFNIGARDKVGGLVYTFFRQLDYRLLTKA